MVCAFRVEQKNMNGAGSVHGGALLTFAGWSLFLIANDHLRGRNSVTVSLNGEFIGGAPLGARLTSRGDVTNAGQSLVFVHALIDWKGEPILNYSGVLKLLKART
jgi:acyl-coenzyme A thioesterase PaaI-like protein